MPILPQYNAQVGELPISGGRRASAEEFSAGLAGVTGLARTVSKAGEQHVARVEEEESRKALVSSSEIRAKYARALDDAQTNGADLEKLKEQMAGELSSVGDNFQTKKGADSLALYSSNTELMFDEQANRIAVQRASANARLEADKLIKSESAILQQNPLYLGVAERNVEALVDTFQRISPENKALLKAELRQNMNMAAALAYARIDPEGAKKRLEGGEWELSAEQRNLAINKSDEQLNARRAAENHARNLAEAERRQRDEAATRRFTDAIVSGKLTGKKLENALTSDPDLDAASVQTLIRFADYRATEIAGGSAKSDEITKRDLWIRVHAPDEATDKIYGAGPILKAVQDGKLNTTDANQLLAAVANQKDENNRSFGTRLQGRIGVVAAALRADPVFSAQPELSAAVTLEMIAQVEKKSAALRAENKDPSGLLDPESKDYYFKPGIIKAVAEDLDRRKRDALPQPVKVTTQAEYDALEPGTSYVDSKGQRGTKRGSAKKPAPVAPAAPQVPAAARSYYEESREKYGPEAAMAFDRLMNMLAGEAPTRESTRDYDLRKTGQR